VAPAPANVEEEELPASGDGTGEAAALGPDPTDLLAIDEEIDLTQLLEELKRWDPVLPERRVREQAGELEVVHADVAGVLTAAEPVRLEKATEPADAVEDPPREDASPASADAGVAVDFHVEGLASPPDVGEGIAELEAVFADMQHHTDERVVAEQHLAAGRVFLAAGLVSEAARALERASLEPRSRFAASLALAELHKSRGQMLDAVSWYEQAAMAPVPDAAVKRAVLYDLAESLETLGEADRALGVLLDLLSQVEDYRDARARLDRLLRVDAGG
jgi:tetratricopeptide (TPR) repeat protein